MNDGLIVVISMGAVFTTIGLIAFIGTYLDAPRPTHDAFENKLNGITDMFCVKSYYQSEGIYEYKFANDSGGLEWMFFTVIPVYWIMKYMYQSKVKKQIKIKYAENEETKINDWLTNMTKEWF